MLRMRPIQPTWQDVEKVIPSSPVSYVHIWFIYVWKNALGGGITYKSILYTEIKNLIVAEFRISFLFSGSPLCSGYHYCPTSFNKAWIQVLRRFKSCSRRVGDLRWWGSLTMVPVRNKAKRLSWVNRITKTIRQFIFIHSADSSSTLSIFHLRVTNKSNHDWNNVSTFVFFKFGFTCLFSYNFFIYKAFYVTLRNIAMKHSIRNIINN